MKKIRAICDLEADGETLAKGTILEIVEADENQIIVKTAEEEYYAMSPEALEAGFEIAET